jgi:hypothetical protein
MILRFTVTLLAMIVACDLVSAIVSLSRMSW